MQKNSQGIIIIKVMKNEFQSLAGKKIKSVLIINDFQALGHRPWARPEATGGS